MKSKLWDLVKMDLLASKKSLLLNLLIPLIYPAFFRSHNETDILSYLFCICLCGFLLFNGFAEMDEKFKTGILLNTLPIKRTDIVTSRFISMYIVYTGTTLLYLLSGAVLHAFAPQLFDIIELSTIPVCLLVVSLINAIQIPLYYVLDLQKSRTVGIILMFGTIALCAYLSEVGWVRNFFQYFTQMNIAVKNCVFLICAVIIFMVARSVTQAIYKRKEF